MSIRSKINLRDLSSKAGLPQGLILRSGKLSTLSERECAKLCQQYNIKCVIDLRTPIEASEFPDPLPPGVEYLQIPLLKDSTIGITHETGSDPMAILRRLRKEPDKLMAMLPDFKALYKEVVTDPYSRGQLDKAVATIRQNVTNGICTLCHCTAGKDRTGIASMAVLKSYGISDQAIIDDFLLTNRDAFWPTIKKCIAVGLLTRKWKFVKLTYTCFMADRNLIEIALSNYN